ncbi:MAG TPA: endolytic transglycosylase MltG, partial [Candidatus Paceibacterota bacterium]|nr:endolytic transglycosylase MltG [Candidatus Paceibacterota bacterium]
EANTPESMRTVAGILLNRLAIGMPLQADATIEYVLEDPLHELPPGQLAVALREVESPYNTYKNLGLPPTPIANPGRQALAAILNPVKSDYLYYITGRDGDFYYATTYAQHQRNIETHLR